MHTEGTAPTATALSLSQAAKAIGRDRTTLLRAIAKGKLSATKDDVGQWWIEPGELYRRYPSAQDAHVQNASFAATGTGANAQMHTPDLARELVTRDEKLAALQQERDRERRQLEETISDLRRRLDASEEERRKKDQQLTALLTDQREKEAQPALPAPRRGFWARLFDSGS